MSDAAHLTGTRRFQVDFDSFFLPRAERANVPLDVSTLRWVGGLGRRSQKFCTVGDSVENTDVFCRDTADIFDNQLEISWLIDLDFTRRKFFNCQRRGLNTLELSIAWRRLSQFSGA